MARNRRAPVRLLQPDQPTTVDYERSPIPERVARQVANMLGAMLAASDQSQILLLHERTMGVLTGAATVLELLDEKGEFRFDLLGWEFLRAKD